MASPAPLAVLISGGLDSAILLGEAIRDHESVHPLYVRCGLVWEAVEQSFLRKYLAALACPNLKPLVTLEMPVTDLYGHHWSLTSDGAPLIGTRDEDVFLPGRNVFLLSKSMLWCHLNQVPAVALGSLLTNPFPDATPQFFHTFQDVVNQAVDGRVQVRLPYGGMRKVEVMKRGVGLPLQWTFSCMSPERGLNCGRCNKCGERMDAFAAAEMKDPTEYAHR